MFAEEHNAQEVVSSQIGRSFAIETSALLCNQEGRQSHVFGSMQISRQSLITIVLSCKRSSCVALAVLWSDPNVPLPLLLCTRYPPAIIPLLSWRAAHVSICPPRVCSRPHCSMSRYIPEHVSVYDKLRDASDDNETDTKDEAEVSLLNSRQRHEFDIDVEARSDAQQGRSSRTRQRWAPLLSRLHGSWKSLKSADRSAGERRNGCHSPCWFVLRALAAVFIIMYLWYLSSIPDPILTLLVVSSTSCCQRSTILRLCFRTTTETTPALRPTTSLDQLISSSTGQLTIPQISLP